MSPARFITLVSVIIIILAAFIFTKFIPPSVLFTRAIAQPVPTLSVSPPTRDSIPREYILPPPSSLSSGWFSQTVPDWKIQFEYPPDWGTPSASITNFAAPGSGTLIGIYFLQNQLEDTPVFLELTSSDYIDASSSSAVFTQTRGNLTNTVITENGYSAYYTYATLPNLKIYVYLPDIQNNLPPENIGQYFNTTSAKIFSGTGLSATDSANLKNFQKLVKSIR